MDPSAYLRNERSFQRQSRKDTLTQKTRGLLVACQALAFGYAAQITVKVKEQIANTSRGIEIDIVYHGQRYARCFMYNKNNCRLSR